MCNIDVFPIFNNLDIDIFSKIKFFCVFGEYGNEAIIVLKNDKVLAFGNNKNGCLGLGHNNAVENPVLVKELCDQQIIDISYGCYHVLALTKSGKCFSWGLNAQGELGNGTTHNNNLPMIMNYLLHETIIKICCGHSHSFVITESGKLYGFGYNIEGEIGCGYTEHQLKPIEINGFNGEKIISIACGGGHSLALTDSGKVYGWGWNNYGQTGNRKYLNQLIPEIINPNNNKIKSISCGYQHSLLLTTDGDIYAFGSNYFGQIGNGQNKTQQMTPLKINENLKFKEIACYHSAYISVAKGIDDYCYVWGHCQNGSFSSPNKTKRKSLEEIFAKYSVIKVTFKAFG